MPGSGAFGFTAGAATRIAGAVGLCALAFFGVWRMEQTREKVAPVQAAPTPREANEIRPIELRLESTCDVVRWNISVDQKTIRAADSDSHHWAGTVQGSAKSEILIDTEAAPGTIERAIRLEAVAGDRKKERVFWSDTDIVERLNWAAITP